MPTVRQMIDNNLHMADKYEENASVHLYSLIESEARKIMKRHKVLVSFCMAMGTWFFTDKHGNTVDENNKQYLNPFADLIYKYDDRLKITGEGMSIKGHDGELVKNW